MSFTLEPLEPKEASKEEPKEAEVTPLFSKDLADFPGKEGLMITVEYPPGSTDPIHRHNAQAFVYVLRFANANRGNFLHGRNDGRNHAAGVYCD
jgi:hypothetical protein